MFKPGSDPEKNLFGVQLRKKTHFFELATYRKAIKQTSRAGRQQSRWLRWEMPVHRGEINWTNKYKTVIAVNGRYEVKNLYLNK